MNSAEKLQHRCHFKTARLSVENVYPNYTDTASEPIIAKNLLLLLTPEVTQELPKSWQNITRAEQAIAWWQTQLNEGVVLVIKTQTDDRINGLLFLYEAIKNGQLSGDVHLGYLLKQSAWGKGYASELLAGLIGWAKQDRQINKLISGVSPSNKASMRVLEKNGFKSSPLKKGETTYFFEYTLKP